MAHASSLEKAKLQMKGLRKQKAKKKMEISKQKEELGEDAWLELQKKKGERDLKQIASIIMWDIKHRQFSECKRSYGIKKLNARLEEIGETLNKFLLEEKREIEVALNGLRNR